MEPDLTSEPLHRLASLAASGDDSFRRDVAAELGRRVRSGDPDALELLVDMLEDEGSYVAEAASDALWTCGLGVLPWVAAVLLDRMRSVSVRHWAARTLSYLQNPRSAQALIEVVRDERDD